ncbi:OLC1v1003746C1 [Oldenlandia corymbosa var. corymbosa]|uniref:RING-type E3 ubiquitin transferase n=1 Tax=Oldenlandia corymbosa var. corymbosa TaxID=529605 RepID=A0AAV1DCK7_OLDCO|nr:OLC1v1003746C1 [Oldenlandia corymbosa var. corymbosa]
MMLKNRRSLLQVPIEEGALESSDLSPEPIFRHGINSSSETVSSRTSTSRLQRTTPFDSSMALTILVLLTALFFMGFFSIYIRRFAEEDSADLRRRRHPSQPGTTTSTGLRNGQKVGGVDSSTIKALPLVSYRGNPKQLITTDCTICLSEFEEGETVKMIPHCRHVFHAPCLDTWLSSHVSCPLCRGTQFFKKPDDGDELRLDVKEEQDDNGQGEFGGRSTAGDGDTWRDEGVIRRVESCTSLGDHQVVLQRSMSF